MDQIPAEIEDADVPKSPNRVKGVLMFALAVVLLVTCIALAVHGVDKEAWGRLRHANPRDVTCMMSLVLFSILLNGWMFKTVAIPFEDPQRRVSLINMTALIGSTCLLNYLPMWAGMIGRSAYLKRYHGVRYRSSMLMMLMVAAVTASVYTVLIAATLWRQRFDTLWWIAVIGSLVAIAVAGMPMMAAVSRRFPGVPDSTSDWFSNATAAARLMAILVFMARAVDVGLTAGRLWLASRVFGTPIDFTAAVVMAASGMFITLVTPLPNGLGVRELLYFWMAQAGVGGAMLKTGALGTALGLIDRGAEAVVFVTAGLTSMAWLHRKRKSS